LSDIEETCRLCARGLEGQHITSVAYTLDQRGEPIVFATTWREALLRSDDVGTSWIRHGFGLTTNYQADEPAFRRPHFKSIAISPAYLLDHTVFLGGFDGLFKSIDGGQSWREMSAALSIGLIVSFDLAQVDDAKIRLIASSYVAGVYSQESGHAWEVNNLGLA